MPRHARAYALAHGWIVHYGVMWSKPPKNVHNRPVANSGEASPRIETGDGNPCRRSRADATKLECSPYHCSAELAETAGAEVAQCPSYSDPNRPIGHSGFEANCSQSVQERQRHCPTGADTPQRGNTASPDGGSSLDDQSLERYPRGDVTLDRPRARSHQGGAEAPSNRWS